MPPADVPAPSSPKCHAVVVSSTRWTPISLVFAVVAVQLLGVACGSQTTGGGATALPLESTNWVLTAGAGLGVPVAGTTAGVQFKGGTASGNAGCNQYNAPY